MPTYYARGVTVRLGATTLADTVTPNITLKKGSVAKKQCEKPEKELLGSQLLHEERVKPQGDDRGFELNWVGGAPFIQVRAGDNLFEETIDERTSRLADTVNPTRLRRQRITENSNTPATHPLALSLHVKTSDRTFISGLDKHNKLHLKIEVFFNGQISSCLFLPPYEIRSNTKTHHQMFAGYRVDYLAERPWVILPPRIAADGSPRKNKSSSLPEDRWKHIGKALSWEADERGTDTDGNTPPTSEFLKALASMEMPAEVRSLQSPGCRNFGVIDVVITAGDGRKVTSGAAYLNAPQRFKDENFPLHAALHGSDDAFTMVEHIASPSPKARRGVEGVVLKFDADADGKSNSDNEPQRKRQALARLLAADRPGREATLPPQSRTRVEGAQSKMAPISNGATPKGLLPYINFVFSTSEQPILKSESVCSNSMSSPERGHTDYNEHTGHPGLTHCEKGSFETPHSFYSFPSSSVGLTHTSQMRPSPYSLHSSDSFRDKNIPSGLMNLPSIDYASFLFSPLQRAPPNICKPCATFGAPRPVDHDQNALVDHGAASMPTILAGAEKRGSLDSVFTPPRVPAAPKMWSQVRSGAQPHGSNYSPLHVPQMWPTSKNSVNFSGSRLNDSPYPSPYDRRLSMPLPPTGLFTVPTKPRSSLSPFKKPRPTKLRMPQGGFLFKRLIITGKSGVAVVDHEWAITQYVANTENRLGDRCADWISSHSSVANPLKFEANHGGELTRRPGQKEKPQAEGDEGLEETRAKLLSKEASPQSRKAPYERPASTHRPPSKNSAPKVKSKRSRPTPKAKAEGPVVINMDKAAFDTSCMPSHDIKTNSRDTSAALMPQRRTISGANILGVQGPKAATFWLEDPEELLRVASKARRQKSPIKRVQKLPATARPPDPVAPAKTSDNLSSPLSSLATTPKPGVELDVDVTQAASAVTLTVGATDPIVQMDGSPERELTPASPTKVTPSPTKLALDSTARISPKVASTPKPTLSPNTKKRKAVISQYLPKQPRSPDRLKTISNPPLNRDCIIAFAESEDKEVERGVLRQVKSERQGVFAEEYVVLATRFFVAGN